MFKATRLDPETVAAAGKLVRDYLQGKPSLDRFYHSKPSLEGFRHLLKTEAYKKLDRSQLKNVLTKQARRVTNTSEASLNHINSLEDQNVFTITTGHQLCLFTGPLYFIYKIISAINLAKNLNASLAPRQFVPVYWMASEDHDFEEVREFIVGPLTYKWQSSQSGAVGGFKTAELSNVYDSLRKSLGEGPHASELLQLFRQSYLEHENLADATRFLVNALFGDQGVVIIDGDDPELKKMLIPEMLEDAFGAKTKNEIQNSIHALEQMGYEAQVKPRDINLFLLTENARTRLERKESGFAAGTHARFTEAELKKEIETHPEKFSPNVSLRPVYQQKILPNLAYVGGPGELAYWLEYRSMFEAYGVTFPILIYRNSFTIVDSSSRSKIEKASLSPADLFKDRQTLHNELIGRSGEDISFNTEIKKLTELFHEMESRVSGIDASLRGRVLANLQKTLNAVDGLKEKIARTLRKKTETEFKRIDQALAVVKPEGTMQERRLNFGTFYLQYGREFIEQLMQHATPFDYGHVILTES